MEQWDELFTWADKIDVPMAVSVWDIPAAEKMLRFDMPYEPVPSYPLSFLIMGISLSSIFFFPSPIAVSISLMSLTSLSKPFTSTEAA